MQIVFISGKKNDTSDPHVSPSSFNSTVINRLKDDSNNRTGIILV